MSAIRSQVPNEVLIALYGVAAMAGAFAGYAAGLGTRTSRLPVYLMGLVVCSVILLIEDIDTPFSGFIAISQQPLRVCPGTSSGITKFSEHEAD